ncbi:unnamed protein product, partial [Urochloa humidicola]
AVVDAGERRRSYGSQQQAGVVHAGAVPVRVARACGCGGGRAHGALRAGARKLDVPELTAAAGSISHSPPRARTCPRSKSLLPAGSLENPLRQRSSKPGAACSPESSRRTLLAPQSGRRHSCFGGIQAPRRRRTPRAAPPLSLAASTPEEDAAPSRNDAAPVPPTDPIRIWSPPTISSSYLLAAFY